MSKENQSTEQEYKALDVHLIKRLMVYLKPYKIYIIFALVLTLGTSSLGPLRPFLTKLAIDNYISKGNWHGLIKMVGAIFTLMMLHGLLQFSLTYILQLVGQKVLYDIRIKLFGHIQKLSLSFYDKNPVGRLVTRVTNDVEGLNEMFSSGVVMILADFMLILWIVGFMFYTNAQLALITLSVLPLLFIATTIFRKKVRDVFRDIRLNVAKMNSFLNEYLSGILTIKLFTQEKKQENNFDQVNSENRNLWVKTVFYYASFFPVIEMISTIALGILIWYTAGHILSGLMSMGTLIAFLQYSEMFFRPIRDLTEKYTTLQSAMASSERIFSLLDTNSFIEEIEHPVIMKPISKNIVFDNVDFSYDGQKQILKKVSFTVNKGETVAIVGATGAGKTSIISLLCRFYDFQSGNILIDGISIRNLSQESLRKNIALVMQDVFLFSRNIADNISLGNKNISESQIHESTKAIGADYFISNLTDGFNTPVMERGSTLSSGQRQLISFSRAFAVNPDILILDEATSNVDSETESMIEQSISRLLSNRTSIIIAHRLSTIKRADRIVVLHHGEVREIGSHKELLEKGGIYSKLYKLQFKS